MPFLTPNFLTSKRKLSVFPETPSHQATKNQSVISPTKLEPLNGRLPHKKTTKRNNSYQPSSNHQQGCTYLHWRYILANSPEPY